MIDVHLKKLRARVEISAAEERAVRGLFAEVRHFGRHQTAIPAGVELNESTLLLEGWLGRSKDLSGGQRQVADLHVPGDFADLHSFTLKRLDHDVIALSRCTVITAPHERVRELTEIMPRLTRIYWFMTNIDAAIHREWALSLGRRPALARMAHLFCELFERLRVVELAGRDGYDFPLTQEELSQCLGLTTVHVNRTLQELRRQGHVEVASGRVRIRDYEALKRTAEFDPAYLYLEKRRD